MSSPPIVIKFSGDSKDLERKVDGLGNKMQSFGSRMKTTWTEVNSAFQIFQTAMRIGQDVWNATAEVALEYNEQIKNLSRNTGLAAEEASQLFQAADDVRISYQSLSTAMRIAQKEGVDVSIDGMARLADEYVKLQPGVERTQFLLDKFGRSGLEMGKLLSLGADGVRDLALSTQEGLIVTEEAIKANDEYRFALDAFNDQVMELKVSIGNELLPVMTKMLLGLAKQKEIQAEANRLMTEGIAKNREQALSMAAATIQAAAAEEVMARNVEGATDVLDENSSALEDNKAALREADDALKAYQDQLAEMSKSNMDAERFIQSYADSQKKYVEDHQAAAKRLQDAIVKGDQEAIAAAREGIQELEATWHESTQRMIYDMVMAKLSVDGLTDAEFKAAQQLAVTMGIRSQADADAAIEMMEKANAIVAGIQAQEEVSREKAAMDAELLALEEAKKQAAGETTNVTVAGANESASAVSEVTAATEREIQAQGVLQEQIKRTAANYALMAAAANRIKTSTSGGGGGMLRDSGGHGVAGKPYMIGTGAQPELFVPQTNGTFIPNADKGMGGDTVYNIVVNNPKRETAENSMRAELVRLSYLGVAS